MSVGRRPRRQGLGDARGVSGGLVLAELQLAFEAFDLHAEPDDAFHPPRAVLFRQILHAPVRLAHVFVFMNEIGQHRFQFGRVIQQRNPSIRVNGDIVSGWHRRRRFVPRWRHICVRSREHSQRIWIFREYFQVLVCPRHMADQYDSSIAVGLKHHRQMRRCRCVLPIRIQQGNPFSRMIPCKISGSSSLWNRGIYIFIIQLEMIALTGPKILIERSAQLGRRPPAEPCVDHGANSPL